MRISVGLFLVQTEDYLHMPAGMVQDKCDCVVRPDKEHLTTTTLLLERSVDRTGSESESTNIFAKYSRR